MQLHISCVPVYMHKLQECVTHIDAKVLHKQPWLRRWTRKWPQVFVHTSAHFARCLQNALSRSDPWQTKFTNICQEIRNISHQSKTKEKHILNKEVTKIDYSDKIVSLDTHGEREMDGAYSIYNTLPDAESSRSSGNPEHYNTPIYNASPTLPSVSPMPTSPHTPLLIPRSWILEPFSDVGLGRACNTALCQGHSHP